MLSQFALDEKQALLDNCALNGDEALLENVRSMGEPMNLALVRKIVDALIAPGGKKPVEGATSESVSVPVPMFNLSLACGSESMPY